MIFSGTVKSDYEKLISVPDEKRPDFIDFGGTSFLQLRDNFIKYIRAVYPNDYNRFIESDLGMMLAEIPAYMGSVINFKSEFLANENILATVQKSKNLANLLELIGVRLRGPTGAAGDAKIILASTPSTFSDPPGGLGGPITLDPSDRAVTITSPQDGAQVSYTLYKVNIQGLLDIVNTSGTIELYGYEADNTTSTVFTNLAFIEGSLGFTTGAFTNADTIKTITLPDSPVIEGSVEVYVDATDTTASGPFREVRNIYAASGPGDKIFQVIYGDSFSAKIVFGDGTFGKSPPTNASYTVTYRVGGGTRGNLAPEVINVIKTWADEVGTKTSTVENVTSITGGTNSETVNHAKKWAPLTFRRQDRCVTLQDYSAFANSFRGSIGAIAKARAVTRDAFSSANVIDIYVLERASDTQLKRATPLFKKELLDGYDEVKMITDEVVIVDGVIRTLDLVMTIYTDRFNEAREELIKQSAIKRVQDFFNIDNSDFGKTLVLEEINRELFKNSEIRYSKVENLDDSVKVDFNEIVQLNNLTINVSYV